VANLVVVRTSYMNSVRNKPLNVGEVLRRYEKMDVASHLACLSRHQGRQVCLGGVVSPFRIYYTPQVTFNATQRYTKLQHKDQLRLAL